MRRLLARLGPREVTLTRAELSALMKGAAIRPSKSLGQHFVADPNTVRRVVRLAGVSEGDRVVEVGAGLGSLTLALLDAGARVTAVEVDRRLASVLRDVVEVRGARVVEADAMSLDWRSILGDRRGWVLVANLPYNVATPLVLRLLEDVPVIERMLVMVQREAGERLAAGVGDPSYGAVSVKVAYWAEAKVVGSVPSRVFLPRPNVESVLVRITRRAGPAVVPAHDDVFSLVTAGFAQRRKMLRRSLAGLVDGADLEAAGVRPEARAEELALEDWGRLAECVQVRPNS